MTVTSGTTNFSPSLGELVINAFARCGLRRTELLTQHLQDAKFEANLMLADWAASGVNLWRVDLVSVPLIEGVATYAVDPSTIFVTEAYIRNDDTDVDRLIFPLSRSDYAAIATKSQQGMTTSYYFDKTLSPSLTLWPVPNASDQFTLKYYRSRQIEDSDLANGTGVDIPVKFLDAFSWQLAARLSAIYAPDRAQALDGRAQRAWMTAISSDTSDTGVKIIPGLASYYR